MIRSRSTGRAGFLAIVVTVAGILSACTAPGASPSSPAASAAPSDVMMEDSPSPADVMMEDSPSPS